MMSISSLIEQEEQRQRETLMLIPSENYTSPTVREALGSMLVNKYAEGYPGARYYEGNEFVDQIEDHARDLAKTLFGVPYANVQPYSGSPANAEILFALCDPGDTIMGLSLSSGGHLTHGHPKVTFSGTYYQSIQFGLGEDARIDYKMMGQLAKEHRPKVIILGTTAYPFILDWKQAREIADSVGAFLVADISHIVGLIIAGAHPSPVPYAHVIMSTTHKTLRGPRGAMILVTETGLAQDPDLGKKIDKAVFPGLQGGPHCNQVAALAVALEEASTSDFRAYGKQIVANAHVLAETLQENGITLVGGGTENHLMVLDFSRSGKGTGTLMARAMAVAGLVANKNTVPADQSPFFPSGVRIGTPGVTTRGMGEEEMRQIAGWIGRIWAVVQDEHFPEGKEERGVFLSDFDHRMNKNEVIQKIRDEVRLLCEQFPA